ncbi:MAG: tetratricopeptide repeat protein [Verrucomicrobiaceae bacterium]|nr:tetratricopeptide repeat protein [Verrucomicrobiaceae bacterium]
MSELSHGLLLQDQGRLEEAEACFYSVLAREPDNDFVYGRLALCQMSQPGKKRRALETVEEAIRLRADESFYFSVKAIILGELHRGRESLEAAETAVRLNPEDTFALSAKANAYCAMDRWADAEEWSRRALALDGDNAMAANILAHTLRLQGKQEDNAEAVARLLAADPEDSFAHVNAGWSALQAKDQARAEGHFREALRLDPESDMAREGLLESFRARSWFYRAYLSYCFFMQRHTEGKQWLIFLGAFAVYQVSRQYLATINPAYSGALVAVWLGLVLWVWLAPGIGNFLILLDRSARLALKPAERHQGIAVGGVFALGALTTILGMVIDHAPVLLAGVGMLATTIPASLTFGNASSRGRLVFGSVTAFLYLAVTAVVVLEWVRHPAPMHPVSSTLGTCALLATVACTWLGNVRALRRNSDD